MCNRAWSVIQSCGNPKPRTWDRQVHIGKVRTAVVAGVAVPLVWV